MTRQIYGAVEFYLVDAWLDVVKISSLLMSHADLNGCLFGVDNYARYVPLFPERGLPQDCSIDVLAITGHVTAANHASWALWSELKVVDWEEIASARDERITEFVQDIGREVMHRKWLHDPQLEHVRVALDRDPSTTIHIDNRVFRRLVLKRRDSLTDTEFPLVMKIMSCLAERFGDHNVRLVVWFD